MTKPTILIEGDSWAYTWLPDQSGGFVAHPGFGDLLRDRGWAVSQTAKAGSSNQGIAQRLQSYTGDWDLLIVVQTEPLRDWLTIPRSQDASLRFDLDLALPLIRAAGSLDRAVEQHLIRPFYQQLCDLAQNRPVWLIGGCAPIDLASVQGLANIQAVIPSVTEWLLPWVKDCYYQDSWEWSSSEYAAAIMDLGDLDLIRDWFDITGRMSNKLQAWTQDCEYFNPDKWHPNHSAHVKIADLLDQTLIKSWPR